MSLSRRFKLTSDYSDPTVESSPAAIVVHLVADHSLAEVAGKIADSVDHHSCVAEEGKTAADCIDQAATDRMSQLPLW